MPNSIGDYPGGEWIVAVQYALCIFQSADGVLGIGAVIERFEKRLGTGSPMALWFPLTKSA